MSETPGWTTPGHGEDPHGPPPSGPALPSPGPPPAYGTPPQFGAPPYAAPPYGAPHYGWGPPPAPKPGVVPLRPLGLGEILDGAFTYIRRNPRTTLGIASVVAALGIVLQLLVVALTNTHLPSFTDTSLQQNSDSAFDGAAVVVSVLNDLVHYLLELIVTGMLTFVMGQAVIGRSVTARAAWGRVKPMFWRLVGTALLTGLIVVGVVVACIAPGVLLVVVGAKVGGIGLIVIGTLAAGPLAIWIVVSLYLAPAALVLESLRPVEALRRSRALVKGSFWRIFGIGFLTGIIAAIIGAIVAIPFALLGGAIGAISFGADGGVTFAGVLGTAAGSIITLPFNAGVVSLLYIDRRMRREGLDLALARAAGIDPSSGNAGAPPSPGTQQW